MAYIGMRKPVAAPISAHTDGSAITYGTGFVIGTAVAATINQQFNDNPDYGDDVIQDTDSGMNGYTGTIDTNDIADDVRGQLLGWGTSGTGDTACYQATDANAPYVGFGFIRVKMFQGTKKYECFWFHKAQFTEAAINASTKQRQIEWNHPQLSITGMGAYIDDSGNAKYFDFKSFTTETAAWTWLKGKANIT